MNKNKVLKLFAILIIIIGILLIIFPYISNYTYNVKIETKEDEFKKQISSEEKDNLLEELYQKLDMINKELFESKQENLTDPFSYEQESLDLSEYGIEDNVIGYIEIPKIEITLPILLGANSLNMTKGAAHLTETSYPIGGENTNSVIAAHRGWSWSKMFRNIDKLEIGDKIYIQNFREKLTYTVCDIKIVNPDNISELEIQEGKDLITLITCHPYRVNTQRYIVKANRSQQIEEEVKTNTTNEPDNVQNTIENELKTDNNVRSSLPSDEGLTVKGVPKTFNQDIMAQANIAYLLGCEDITDSTNLEEYINNHIPNNGILISERTIYQKTDNPYDFIKERKEIMIEMLSSINLTYNIDKNNYLINNQGNGELEQKINKLISGDKKIIIGFVAGYYTYINNTEYGLQLGGGFTNSSYVSFKPYNNIYAYIFDENSANIDDFYNMIEEISKLDD